MSQMRGKTLASHLSLFEKQDHIRSLSEAEFRDKVLRPLFLRMGLKDGRDYCGPLEEGKDCVFLHRDPLGDVNVYAVQTKAGDLNMSSKASRNVVTALTQVRTMLETDIPFIEDRRTIRPHKVFLCASGKINDRARRYILDEVKTPQIEFRDLDSIIPQVDEHMPEFWLGVDASKSPYLASLLESLTSTESDYFGTEDVFSVPQRDDVLIQLRVNRIKMVSRRERGRYHAEEVARPEFEEFSAESIAARTEPLCLLAAGAGEGKTTTLRRIAFTIAKDSLADLDNATIPVLVRASRLAEAATPFLEYVAEETAKLSRVGSVAFGQDDLDGGRVVVLVDGLDEVPDHTKRQKAVSYLTEFIEMYPRCRVILSSRNYVWLDDIRGIHRFERFSIARIDWREASKMARKLARGKQLPAEQTSELLRRLQEVHGMELTPLLISVFLAASDAQRQDIPANITELFKKFTEQMLGRWDEKKGFSQQFQAPLKDFLLQRVALKMHQEGLTSIPLEGLESVLRDELERRGHTADTAQLLEEMVDRSGLFRTIGSDVEFRHMLLQEFFAGRAMSASEVEEHIGESWWQRCIVFYFGENPDELETLQGVVQHLSLKKREEHLQAAFTMGLALQACYLLPTEDKALLYVETVEAMGKATHEMHGTRTEVAGAPVLNFVGEYLFGRDSATCDVLRSDPGAITSLLPMHPKTLEEQYILFWYLVGLMECGLLEEALDHLHEYDPEDRRSLLSLHLGALMYEHTRVSTKEERNLARRINEYLGPKIAPLRKALLEEFKSELLEVRLGSVTAIKETSMGSIVEPDGQESV